MATGTFWRGYRLCFCGNCTGGFLSPQLDILKGNLDLMVLQTLEVMGALHGYGIARRIEQVSGDPILLNQGRIYASLVRLQERGLIPSEWGVSNNNRRAKFYSITRRGSRRLASSSQNWEQLSIVIGRFFATQKEPHRSTTLYSPFSHDSAGSFSTRAWITTFTISLQPTSNSSPKNTSTP